MQEYTVMYVDSTPNLFWVMMMEAAKEKILFSTRSIEIHVHVYGVWAVTITPDQNGILILMCWSK